MAVADNIRKKLSREPFEPFVVRVTSGHTCTIRDPDLVVVMRSELFIAEPRSDRHVFVPLDHVAAVETAESGRNGNSRRRRKAR
jgi:hypothetical protein